MNYYEIIFIFFFVSAVGFHLRNVFRLFGLFSFFFAFGFWLSLP